MAQVKLGEPVNTGCVITYLDSVGNDRLIIMLMGDGAYTKSLCEALLI